MWLVVRQTAGEVDPLPSPSPHFLQKFYGPIPILLAGTQAAFLAQWSRDQLRIII
jgi:hypothetical protein